MYFMFYSDHLEICCYGMQTPNSVALGELLVHLHGRFLPYYHKEIETHHVLSGICVLIITFLSGIWSVVTYL